MNISRALILLAMVSVSNTAMAADDIATVNGKPISKNVYDFIVKDAEDHGKKIDDNISNAIKNKLIDSEIVFQEAQKLGLDKSNEYVAREELARRELLTGIYLQDFIKKNPISDKDIKAEYENYKKAFGEKEYNARHILVKTEAEAKDIIAKLSKGGDFAKIAKEKSLDPGSKVKGGDLGWFSPATMVKPFSDAIATLKKGETSKTPVQTQFGWHVINLVDTKAAKPTPFDQMKDGLKNKLQQEKLEEKLSDLRSKAKVVLGK